MVAKNLYFLLEETVKQNRTVELYFRGKVNHDQVAGSVVLITGQIFRFGLGKYFGRTALQFLPRVDLTMAVALPLEDKLSVPEVDTPEANELLLVLKNMVMSILSDNKVPETLILEVNKIIRNTLGTSAATLVEQIAQNYAPTSDPKGFLQQIYLWLSEKTGATNAKQVLEPLLKKYQVELIEPQVNTKSSSDKNQPVLVPRASSFLFSEVEQIFQGIFGTGASIQLAKIAQRYSPQEKPVEFLLECKNLLEPMVGENAAKKMLEPLYESI